ncbi:hypothetical protein RB653_005160 [Dictyostelium firmibasis]|uniref:Uncharacterized protein n=1 Tax=Dictyostelium firmibasis TaxID=79012 RepID=A0AAN7UKK4_9MYCE
MDNYNKKKEFYFLNYKQNEEIEEIIDSFVENPVDENMLNNHYQHQQENVQNLNEIDGQINSEQPQINVENDDMIVTYSNTNISNYTTISSNNFIKLELNNQISNNNLKFKRRNSLILDNVETFIRIDTANKTSCKKRRMFI